MKGIIKDIESKGYTYKYELSSKVAQNGDYTLSISGSVHEYNSQHILWMDGCPKILASNNPSLSSVLPVLESYTVILSLIIGYKDDNNIDYPVTKQVEYNVWASSEQDAKERAKELDKSSYSIYEVYVH